MYKCHSKKTIKKFNRKLAKHKARFIKQRNFTELMGPDLWTYEPGWAKKIANGTAPRSDYFKRSNNENTA